MNISNIFKKFKRPTNLSNSENVDTCLKTYLMAKAHIKKFRVAVDIGCRDGDFSRPMLNDFENIFAFDYRDRLKFNSSKLCFYNCALGDEELTVRASGGAITNLRNTKVKKVNQKTLDSFNFENVDFIKIDVEGHELKVLKGSQKTLEKYNPVICMEENGSQVKWGKGIKNDALDYLISRGYKVVAKNEPPLSLDYVLIRE